ncbi:MAG: DUF4154 domain-containing protein [Prolixibacteraceae bacterium]|nr:DUF4154 domain-containing protein [Prolixibacteraceae bacterium]
MKKHFLIFFLFAIGIFPPMLVNAQADRASLIGAYTYNFAQYTSWQNEKEYNNFSILLISNNEGLIREFEQFADSRKIKRKPINLDVQPYPPGQISGNTRMIVLPKEELAHFNQMYRMIEQRPVLLISEGYSNQRNVMINLYQTDKNELVFEVNKANIISHNLTIDPEILLLGGTEIDIAELYRSAQRSIDSLQIRMGVFSDSLSMLNEKIALTLNTIKTQQDSIHKQKLLLGNQHNELAKGLKEIERQKSDIGNQRNQIDNQKSLLKTQEQSLKEQIIEISEQQTYNALQQKEIKKSKQTLDSLMDEINQKNIELIEQGELIKRQKQISVLLIVVAILFLVLLISVFTGFRNKMRKNKLLVLQKNKIGEINDKLRSTNKSLYETIKRLSETQSQLVASEKMASLGVLTAGIAHEINNPVNFIYTGINSLKKDIEDLLSTIESFNNEIGTFGNDELINKIKDIKEANDWDEILEIIPQTIADIKIGAERAADIIKGLRDFSRIDKDAKQCYDIHEGIESSLLLLKNKFKNHIKIVKEYKQLPKIECYPGKLNQALLNILSNSIDAIEKEGTITLRTWLETEEIKIQIEDTGKGISKENLEKIFDPFFTTKSVGKGTGLGLSITFGIIKEHNGKIDVKSDLNNGTVFTISLPCIFNHNNTQ